MEKRRRVIYIVLVLALLVNYALVFADNLEELKDKKSDALQQIDRMKQNRQRVKKEANDVGAQIEELDKQMDLAASELEKTENQLGKLNQEIEIVSQELEEAIERIDDKQDVFNSRLRVIYKNGNVGYLEVLLASADIGDFLSRKDMIQSIVNHDVELLKYMKEQRGIVENKKTELQAKRASVEVAKSKLMDRRKDLASATRSKELYMEKLVKEEKELEKQEDALIKFAKEIESQIVSLQRVDGPYTGGIMAWPVPVYTKISSYFGYRIHPIYNTKKLHTGVDIASAAGNKVIAASDGVVIYSGTLGSYGKTIMIDHGGGIVTLYGHNSALVVNEGQKVNRGDTIAKIGSTGVSTGPHCHFEVRKNGSYVDPMPYLKGN